MTDGIQVETNRGGALGALAVGVAIAALALALAHGSLGAPLVSDDTAALGYVHQQGPWADLFQPQYDLRTVRFWRPLVTASLGLQEAWTGPDAAALRAFNLCCHLLTGLLAAGLARRLGAGALGALVAGWAAVSFPFQGGTVTWIVGRVDSQCLPLVLACALFALDGRRWASALAAALALATKEAGIAAPMVAAVLLWGRGDRLAEVVRGAAPAALATAAAFVLRRIAIGSWVGGYSAEVQVAGGALGAGLASAAEVVGWLLGAAAVAVLLCALVDRRSARAGLAGLAAAVVCLGPLLPLLAGGALPAVHRRWLLAPDLFVGLALALALGGLARTWRTRTAGRGAVGLLTVLVAAGAAAVLVDRATRARSDVERWSTAGLEAAAREAEVRAALVDVGPSERPVLDAVMPRVNADGTAYVAQWGVADRYRPPFEPTARPVWPWRRLFDAAQSPRRSVTTPRSGLRWPPGEAQLTVAPIGVDLLDRGAPVERIRLDDRLLADLPPGAGPELHVFGEFPAPRVEFVLFTELGYGTAVWASMPPAEELSDPAGAEAGALRSRRVLPLRDVFMAANRHGMPLYHVLRQAADLGAEVAYLELRAVDDERGQVDRPIAASRWIELNWDESLRRLLLQL